MPLGGLLCVGGGRGSLLLKSHEPKKNTLLNKHSMHYAVLRGGTDVLTSRSPGSSQRKTRRSAESALTRTSLMPCTPSAR